MTPKQRIIRRKEMDRRVEEKLKELGGEVDEKFLEFAMLGSLLYKVDKDGNTTRIKRVSSETGFLVKSVSIVDDKIILEE